MALTVNVHRTATRLDEHTCDDMDACREAGHHWLFADLGFEASLRGLEPITVGKTPWPGIGEYVAGAGWFKVSAPDWGANYPNYPYGAHSAFRDALAMLVLGVSAETVWADPGAYRDRPFFELIQFADNEGNIGPLACADLAADFAEHKRDAVGCDLAFQDDYRRWSDACHAAAGTGVLDFR